MTTYLLTWNPNKWEWEDISQKQEELKKLGHSKSIWSCGTNKSINAGDRLFLIRLGKEPKGICASGYASSNYFPDKHWSGEPNKTASYIELDFDIILNPDIELILSIDKIKHLEQHWSSQSSGISINDEIVEELEKIWFEFNNKNHSYNSSFFDKLNINQTYTEGRQIQTTLSRYERNPYARKECIKYYGYSCSACKFNFYNTYGKIGENFIHVHHIKPISSRKEEYELNPIKDLRPVCPNCHAMLHQSNPPLTIEELQNLIK